MQAAPARYVSVSELYSTDEVELLLDEIRDLEPTSCRGEDVQDFEIAGSGLGAWGSGGGGGGGGGGGAGGSPAGTELTERSWDSHAHYSRAAPPRPARRAPLYCRLRYLLTPVGTLTLLMLLCSASACVVVWAAVGARLYALPQAARPQLLQLGALSSSLLHAALLTVHVGGLTALLPLRWDLLALVTSLWSSVSMSIGGALTLHVVLTSRDYRPAPPVTRDMLVSAASLGMFGAVFGLAIVTYVGLSLRPLLRAPSRSSARSTPGAGAQYRAVPRHPPAPAPAPPPPHPHPQPSTSRANPL